MIRFIRFTCSLFMLAFSVQAADHYVCSNGSDSNDGLSHETAWRTYAKAHSVFGILNGGDSILFCKGEEFVTSGVYRWENKNSTRDNPITISSYTPPGGTKLTNPTVFASGGSNGIELSNGGNAEHKEGFVVSNLILRGNKISGNGIFIYNDTDFVSVINVEIYDFRIGIHAGGANATNPGSDGKNSDLKIQGVYIHDNHTQGFLGGGDNLLIEDSIFVNNGWDRAILNHNIYISGNYANETIRNNHLYQSAMFEGKCRGVSLVAHGIHTNLHIEGNVIWEDVNAASTGCWGIAVDNGYAGNSPEQFSGLVIRENTVINVGNVAIGCSVCQEGVIEDNTIVHQGSFGAIAISVPNRDENAYPALPQSNNMTVRNNIVLHDSPAHGVGVSLGDGDASNYTSVGNQIYYTPGSGMVAGCESYNAGDVISVSAGICQNSIPQNLLNNAIAKTKIPLNLSNLANPTVANSEDANAENASSGSAGAIGWYYLGLLVMLLGIKFGLNNYEFRSATISHHPKPFGTAAKD